MGRLCDMCAYYSSVITRADCWALAALTAVDVAQSDLFNKVNFDLEHVGRTTCADGNLLGDSASETAVFPSPHITSDGLVNYFATEFGFSPDETVAIMGAHTLGTLSNQRSGFNGAWVHGERVFDNEFFTFLVDNLDPGKPSTKYVQDNASNSNGQYSWIHQSVAPTGPRAEIMLNADMALIYNFAASMDDSNKFGKVTCVLRDDGTGAELCNQALTLDKVSEYSQDNDLWVNDFHAAFTKMLVDGHDTNHCVAGKLCNHTH
mmetsp:Transcript_11099/g.22718  ORF Transcript_11099/g.22718 Transcript_11099/m.22718 type:complete len:262 (-) Transcript_11099:477-1262(-)